MNNTIEMPEEGDLALIRGTKCFVHRWDPATTEIGPKALIVLYHGFLDHGRHPSTRCAAEFFCEAGYAVVSVDLPGHGKSEGKRGYLKSSEDLIETGLAIVQHAQSMHADKNLQLVLCGFSMGGAIALSVAHKLGRIQKDDDSDPPLLILMAPMLKLDIPSVFRWALMCLSCFVPTEALSSSESDSSKIYRDENKRKECERDPLTPPKLRIGSLLTLADTALHVAEVFDSVSNPYLLLVADEDVEVNSEGSEEFHKKSLSKDKTKKNYPALHALLCEPSPLFDEIKSDILEWLEKRVSR